MRLRTMHKRRKRAGINNAQMPRIMREAFKKMGDTILAALDTEKGLLVMAQVLREISDAGKYGVLDSEIIE